MSDNAREARGKGDWSRVAKAKRLSVFEHVAKYAPDPVAKTNPLLGQARRNKTRNSLELNEL